MRFETFGFQRFGQGLTALLAVILAAALAAPVGLRSAAAQDDGAIQTRIQVLHAATDLGKVEVHFNNDEALDEFEYGSLSDWIDLDPGAVNVWITRDRAGFNYTVFNAVYPAPAGNDYSLIITDALVIGGVFDRSPVTDGEGRISITHASVDTPAVNVVATGSDNALATQLGYGQSSEKVELPAGSLDLELRLADTGETLATIPGVAIDAGMVTQLVIMGDPGNDDKPLTVQPIVSTTLERTPGATPNA